MAQSETTQPGSVWGNGPATALPPVRHSYNLVERQPSLSTAFRLMLRSLPYAIVRFGILLATAIAAIIWLAVAFGGAAWLGTHLASAFAVIWLLLCLIGYGFVWSTMLRYLLHLIECGHVAVLTELITTGSIDTQGEGMFAHGKKIVLARIGQETMLFGLNALVRGVVTNIHRTLDWIGELLPIPGLEGMARLIDIVLKGATRYLDKVIFSYTLARGSEDPWRASREGLIYYAQNVRPVLKTAIWSIVLERVLTVVLWLLLLAPAALITLALPSSARELGGLMTVLVAVLLVGPVRGAFIKPLFMIMMMIRYHTSIEGQPINPEWDARLSSLSQNFQELGADAAERLGQSRWLRL